MTTTTTKQKLADIAERALWTLLEAGFGVEAVNLANLPPVWAVPIAGALAGIKSLLAAKFSNNGTAAILPAALDSPAVPAGRHEAPEPPA